MFNSNDHPQKSTLSLSKKVIHRRTQSSSNYDFSSNLRKNKDFSENERNNTNVLHTETFSNPKLNNSNTANNTTTSSNNNSHNVENYLPSSSLTLQILENSKYVQETKKEVNLIIETLDLSQLEQEKMISNLGKGSCDSTLLSFGKKHLANEDKKENFGVKYQKQLEQEKISIIIEKNDYEDNNSMAEINSAEKRKPSMEGLESFKVINPSGFNSNQKARKKTGHSMSHDFNSDKILINTIKNSGLQMNFSPQELTLKKNSSNSHNFTTNETSIFNYKHEKQISLSKFNKDQYVSPQKKVLILNTAELKGQKSKGQLDQALSILAAKNIIQDSTVKLSNKKNGIEEKNEKIEKLDKSEKSEKTEKTEKTEKSEKIEANQNPRKSFQRHFKNNYSCVIKQNLTSTDFNHRNLEDRLFRLEKEILNLKQENIILKKENLKYKSFVKKNSGQEGFEVSNNKNKIDNFF